MTTPGPATPPTALPRTTVIGRIFLPFALGYFMSYLFRTVNAVVGPVLADELHLSAGDLGLLTSAYFFTFAAFQLPLGILLDRYGAKHVEATLLLFAALGAALFASGESITALIVGRALIGLGVSACLMAAFKAFVVWYPHDRLPLANGLMTACGGLGAMAATAPVEALLGVTDWRTLFWGLAVITVAVAGLLVLAVPHHGEGGKETHLTDQIKGMIRVLKHPLFLKLAPACFISQAAFNGIQGLWAGPWLRDVAGLSSNAVANGLLVMTAGMITGYALFGLIADKLRRHGVRPLAVFVVGNALFILTLGVVALGWTGAPYGLWFVFGLLGPSGILMYAVLSQNFDPALAGRVNTALNLLVFVFAFAWQWGIGAIIDSLSPMSVEMAGGYGAEGYAWAFGGIVVIQIAAFAWMMIAPQHEDTGSDRP